MNERNIESGGSYVTNGDVIELAIGNFFFFFFPLSFETTVSADRRNERRRRWFRFIFH